MTAVWLIGAGASASNSAQRIPVTAGLLAKAKEMKVITDLEIHNDFRQLDAYVSRLLGTSLLALPEFDPEYALSMLDIDIAVSPNPSLQEVRRQLIEFIRRVIDAAQASVPSGTSEYDKLAERLNPGDSVLTLNWDLTLDRALGSIRAHGANGQIYPQTYYGRFLMTFTGFGDSTIDGAGYPAPTWNLQPRDGQYLKLHGSIDWYRCINPGCPNFERLFPLGTSQPIAATCPKCTEPSELTLIPPTMDKRLRSIPIVRRLWNAANHIVSHADELVIWGYSAPSTDFFATWLLARAFRSRLSRLVLINPAIVATEVNSEPSLDEDFVRRVAPKVGQAANSIEATFYQTFQDYRANRQIDVRYAALKGEADTMRQFFQARAKARPERVVAKVKKVTHAND